MTAISFTVNGHHQELEVEPRQLLVDVLRDQLRLTGTHIACEEGSCGSCTVLVDGAGTRSCLMFAVQADGAQVLTIEGVGGAGALHPLQAAFRDHHGLQCGFCTPGMVLAALELLDENPRPSREQVAEALSGNLCRCTGYESIIDAVCAASEAGASTAPLQDGGAR